MIKSIKTLGVTFVRRAIHPQLDDFQCHPRANWFLLLRHVNHTAAAEELHSLLTKANEATDKLKMTLENLRLASGELQLASTSLRLISRLCLGTARHHHSFQPHRK